MPSGLRTLVRCKNHTVIVKLHQFTERRMPSGLRTSVRCKQFTAKSIWLSTKHSLAFKYHTHQQDKLALTFMVCAPCLKWIIPMELNLLVYLSPGLKS